MIRTPRFVPATISIIVVAVLVLGACSSSANDSGANRTSIAPTTPVVSTNSSAAAATVLTIENFAFSALTGVAGESISVVNGDNTTHTVTADDGSFDIQVGGGQTGTVVLPKAGTYAIHCKIHSSMHGTIVVK